MGFLWCSRPCRSGSERNIDRAIGHHSMNTGLRRRAIEVDWRIARRRGQRGDRCDIGWRCNGKSSIVGDRSGWRCGEVRRTGRTGRMILRDSSLTRTRGL